MILALFLRWHMVLLILDIELVGIVRLVEVLCSCLRHRAALILQLQRALRRETDLMLLLHLVDLRVLLLHDVRQLQLV